MISNSIFTITIIMVIIIIVIIIIVFQILYRYRLSHHYEGNLNKEYNNITSISIGR